MSKKVKKNVVVIPVLLSVIPAKTGIHIYFNFLNYFYKSY